jgi:YfiH family protein
VSWITHPLLTTAGVEHGFGTRACSPPPGLVRPRQVHGTRVVTLRALADGPADTVADPLTEGQADLGEADAVVSERPAQPIGVVTADCLPVLVATSSGRVAAIHAGWRGLAAGVIGEALAALVTLAPEGIAGATAVVGPRIGSGCHEVDAPVVEALTRRFPGAVDRALVATRPGHWQLDLASLACADLVRSGISADRIAALDGACTACDAERFHSYRRDGPRSGRLFHWIAARPGPR